jgi:phosphoglycolate phosphatase
MYRLIGLPTLKIDGGYVDADLILFDLDGTLVDDRNRYKHLASARLAAVQEAAGSEASLTWAKLMGVNPETGEVDMAGPISKAPRREDLAVAAAALYQHGHPWHEARDLAQRAYDQADRVQAELYTPRLYPGAAEALRRLREARFKLGMATNGEARITRQVLRGLDIEALFEVVVGADMVVEGKPAPDMILAACEILGVEPSRTIYVGDQPTDVDAGRRASVAMVILVGDHEPAASGADVVLKSVAELS